MEYDQIVKRLQLDQMEDNQQLKDFHRRSGIMDSRKSGTHTKSSKETASKGAVVPFHVNVFYKVVNWLNIEQRYTMPRSRKDDEVFEADNDDWSD